MHVSEIIVKMNNVGTFIIPGAGRNNICSK